MKNYDEVAKELFERRKQYIAKKKAKNKILASVLIPMFSVTFISLLVLAIWPGDNSNHMIKVPTVEKDYNNGIIGSIIKIEDVEAETEENSESDNDDDMSEETPNKKPNNNQNNKSDKNTNKKPDKSTNKKPDKNTNKKPGKNDNKKPDNKPGNVTDNQPDADDNSVDTTYSENILTSEDVSIDVVPDNYHNNHSSNKDNNIGITQNHTNTDSDKFIEKIEVTQLPIKTVYYLGDSFDFRGLEVTGYFSNGDIEDITPYVQFYSTVACRVNNNFRVLIEYTDNSEALNLVSTEFYLTVLEPTVSISENKFDLVVGDTAKNTAYTEAGNYSITWYSTDTSVVNVDNDGNITAMGSGNAYIYAVLSYYDSRDGYTFTKESAYCSVTVN